MDLVSDGLKVMVQHTEVDSTPLPTTLPCGAANKEAEQEPVVSLVQTPINRGLHVSMSPVKTAAQPAESGNEPLPSPAVQTSKLGRNGELETGPSHLGVGNETSPRKGVLPCDTETPPFHDTETPPSRKAGRRSTKRPAETIPPSPSLPALPGDYLADDGSIFSPPAKIPRKRGRKSKAELMLMRMQQQQQQEALAREESKKEEEQPDVTSSGRPRRRAAKAALRYLHDIAEEWSSSATSPPRQEPPIQESEPTPDPTGMKRARKRKSRDSDDDRDVDFVVPEDLLQEEEEEEEKEDDEEEDIMSDESECEANAYNMSVFSFGEKMLPLMRGFAKNGFHNSIMAPVWRSAQVTLDFRNLHHSDWEFPDWVPHKDNWHFLSCRDAETYIPLQPTSPPFSIKREGIEEEAPCCMLGRFQSLPPHPQRWDSTFFVGGPVWAMEWCPTLAGSGACQYLALYCHRGMDDRHNLQATHTGPALLQLWKMGPLDIDDCCMSTSSFSYGLALDEGCIWDMKFCPSGGWELPSTSRKSTQMARLGILATAFSSGHVEIYSLPHPEPLSAHRKSQVKDPWELTICKVDCILRLHVGSIKACKPGKNGQCFSLAWLHSKPHQYLAAGFYDGTVSIWDLKTKSALQKVRQGHVIKQYPFLSFSAHNHAVRCIEWCKVDRNFLATSGGDRHLKFWDLRRLVTPVNDYKRFKTTEMAWLLPYCGVVVAQDNCYSAHGLCGIHYMDSGFLGFKPYLAAPRRGTVWSISGSDWLGSVTAGDMTGEVMAAILPGLNVHSVNCKRPADRRFPIYKADFLYYAPPPAQECHSDNGDLPSGPLAENDDYKHFKPKSFRAAEGHFSLLFQDSDLRDFHHMASRESTKRMQASETKGEINIERVQLESIHRVRFSPNLDTYTWMVSGGHSGLVRVHCVRGLLSPVGQKMIQEKRAQFQAMFEVVNTVCENDYTPEVQHCVVQV